MTKVSLVRCRWMPPSTGVMRETNLCNSRYDRSRWACARCLVEFECPMLVLAKQHKQWLALIGSLVPFGLAIFLIMSIFDCSTLATFRGLSRPLPLSLTAPIPSSETNASSKPKTIQKVPLALFAMSQCPYTAELGAALQPALHKLSDHLDFALEFIGNETGTNLESLHGDNEMMGDRIQLCAQHFYPEKLMDLIVCMNQNQSQIPQNWEDCAQKLSLSTMMIKLCAQSETSESMLRHSFRRSRRLDVQSSPTLFIAGKRYTGLRQPQALMRAICGAFGTAKPAQCNHVPQPMPVPITILDDKRCQYCQTDTLQKRLRHLFPAAKLRVLDYSDEQGKKLYQELNLTFLPAVLLGMQVTQTESYQKIKRYIVPTGDYFSLYVGINHNPTQEICSNGIDDNQNDLIDCLDPDCQSALQCREEIHNRLDVFVMSHCRLGMQLLKTIPEVLRHVGDQIKLRVHYLAHAADSGFQALGGPAEIAENMRQLCAMEHYEKKHKYFEYILCRGRNHPSSDWRACTGYNGIDATVIEKCVASRGADLLAKDIQLANELGFRTSPTLLVNNRYTFRGFDAKAILKKLCNKNPSLPNCRKKRARRARTLLTMKKQ